ncbi:MAG: sensor histidine kinase [Burkholderiales bacterium PBB4]|nr:MAG: sensor histidine kinase [Burkholderiales bacterium PBB4]
MTSLNAFTLRQSWRAWLGSDPHPVGPMWLAWVWTFLFCCVCAVFFTILGFASFASGEGAWRNWTGWWHWYQVNLVVALFIGFTIRGLFVLGHWWLGTEGIRKLSGFKRFAYFIGVPNLGVAIGWPVGSAVAGYEAISWRLLEDPNALASSVLLAVIISFVFYLLFSAAARRLQAEKRAAEAQLRLLQGQIEPHFLFNTLANVSSLMDDDVLRAKFMLETFTDYLRASLGSLRRLDATLGGELDLVSHYLALMKTRMEDRLQYSVHCEPDMRDVHLPPFVLQPLVENALHHGLEPKVEGGTVAVVAKREGPMLVLEVRDDGMGPDATRRRPGAGMALANVRERLVVQYGSAASLTLTPTHPGMCASLRMPLAHGASA